MMTETRNLGVVMTMSIREAAVSNKSVQLRSPLPSLPRCTHQRARVTSFLWVPLILAVHPRKYLFNRARANLLYNTSIPYSSELRIMAFTRDRSLISEQLPHLSKSDKTLR